VSLLEVTVVIAVAGVATAVAVPRYLDSVERTRLESAAKRVAADIDATRQRAITNGVPQSILFDASGYTISICTLSSTTTQRVDLTAPPYSAKATAARVAGNSTLTFDQFGASTTPALISVKTGYLVRYISFNPDSASIEVTQASPLKNVGDGSMINDADDAELATQSATSTQGTAATAGTLGGTNEADLVTTTAEPK
jgi:Tfp pilus assembly protein FimT